MKKIFKNIIIGSGFSAFILNKFLKKDFLIITTNDTLIGNFPKRKMLTPHLRFLDKKFSSYGIFNYSLNNSILHDTVIHGGNTNLWGGICNVRGLGNKLKNLEKIIKFKKISINDTGSYSKNNFLYQMQNKNSKTESIFNCSEYFKNLIYGHLISFKIENKNLISLRVQKQKGVQQFYCRKLILALNTTQLIEVLINSKFINDQDKISLNEHQFKTKISFTPYLTNQKKNNVILSYSLSGILKHTLGKKRNFNKYFSSFLNLFPLFYHQIFFKKKISANYRFYESEMTINEIANKTANNFGKSVHYFNMKLNNIEIEKFLNKKNKNIFGISSPFITNKEPGPISNSLIEKSISLSKKLNLIKT